MNLPPRERCVLDGTEVVLSGSDGGEFRIFFISSYFKSLENHADKSFFISGFCIFMMSHKKKVLQIPTSRRPGILLQRICCPMVAWEICSHGSQGTA